MGYSGGYGARDICTWPEARYQMQSIGYANPGGAGSLHFYAPPGTTIGGFSLAFDGRTADGHYAEVWVIDWGGGRTNLHRAANEPGGYLNLGPWWGNWSQVVIQLRCANPRGSYCPPSSAAHAWVRNVELYLNDHSAPVAASLAGSLVERSGWLRGPHEVRTSATDSGSGLLSVEIHVNGLNVSASYLHGCGGAMAWPYTRLVNLPCPASRTTGRNVETASGPFRNGSNTIVAKALDWAGNVSWSGARTVRIDNAPPKLAFTNTQAAEDPELIRAPFSDPHSGIHRAEIHFRAVGAEDWHPLETRVQGKATGGELQARLDSSAVQPGEYELLAEATDAAGNRVQSGKRADGQPMRLRLPLKTGAELTAHLGPGGGKRTTVGYRRPARVAGRLLDAAGAPLADREVLITERFGPGALIRERPTTVTTDEQGRFESKLPGGPSRSVEVAFGGTRRYLSDREQAGRLRVRSRARFGVSRKRIGEGGRVVFRGKIGHFGARIPPGGKLVELQVREPTGGWETVGEAFRSRASGRYRRGYRFGDFYERDVAYRFRVKVAREQGWPYKAPTKSKPRRIVVAAS